MVGVQAMRPARFCAHSTCGPTQVVKYFRCASVPKPIGALVGCVELQQSWKVRWEVGWVAVVIGPEGKEAARAQMRLPNHGSRKREAAGVQMHPKLTQSAELRHID